MERRLSVVALSVLIVHRFFTSFFMSLFLTCLCAVALLAFSPGASFRQDAYGEPVVQHPDRFGGAGMVSVE